jgi:ABC-type transport system involved in cytochrome bd biosynthesis fused ATPase/permease subunit
MSSECAKVTTIASLIDADEDSDGTEAMLVQNGVFTWKNVTLDIEIKGQQRRILDGISGWVKPGTLTALMGSSGAGKTSLCKDT